MPAQILKPTAENLAQAAHALLQGELVAMPTETVYGLAGLALDPLALARIFETKERPTFDPLILHVGISTKRIAELDRIGLVDSKKMSRNAIELADRLISQFWPGPLTLVLPKKDQVPDLATSGLATVAVRMPRHSNALALIAAVGQPLAAPSANRFGRISPTRAEDVFSELGDRIQWIVDGGPCEVGVESTILSISDSGSDGMQLTLLRPGGLSLEEIEKIASQPVIRATASVEGTSQLAPGMLASHYAPRKKLLLLPKPLSELKNLPSDWTLREKIGLLVITGQTSQAFAKWKTFAAAEAHCISLCISLSESGDLNEAARNLFHSLRELDESDAPILVSEPCLDLTGLGYAIGDRLRRAAATRED